MAIEKKTLRKDAPVIGKTKARVESSVKGHNVVLAPEIQAPPAEMRTRLSKAFSRPLDKQLKKVRLVRDRITFPEIEYEQLIVLKKRLSDQKFMVKKSQLVRAGLMLLALLDDDELKKTLVKVPPAR